MKRAFLLFSCLAMVFVVQAAGAGEAEKYKDKPIEDPLKEFFQYSSVDEE